MELIGSPKRRYKFLDALHHSLDVDDRWAEKIPNSVNNPLMVVEALRSLGAPPNAYVMSDMMSSDQSEVALERAVDEAQTAYGAVISCIPGRLAYFQGEERGERFILNYDSRRIDLINRVHPR